MSTRPRKGVWMVKTRLTERQREILGFIRDRVTARGTAPTIREIGKKFAISSTNGVRAHLKALIRKGYLKKREFVSRGLELAQQVSLDIGRVPVVGSVPAGMPIDAVENREGAAIPWFRPEFTVATQ
jgi:repressor LexA